jgi:uncharacterized protein
MYEFDKQRTNSKPALMDYATFCRTIDRIAEHAPLVNGQQISISFHGGEPLLIGRTEFTRFARYARATLADTNYIIGVQTNGILLDQAWLDLFDAMNIAFSISFDGPPVVHDSYRKDHAGRPTAAKVLSAIKLVSRHSAQRLFGGILSVIDPSASGRLVMKYLFEQEISKVNFLLPDGNFANPPKSPLSATGLQSFLCDAFDEWYFRDNPNLHVTLFEETISTLLGGTPSTEQLAGINGSVVIVESDGDLVPHDVLRTCGPRKLKRLNVSDSPMSALRSLDFYPWSTMSTKCKACRIVEVCNGGYPPSRFDGLGFQNPSYHCEPLMGYIHHVAARVQCAIKPELRHQYPRLSLAITNAR